MAAIDKIYLKYSDYLEFKKWCSEQPGILDKYGKTAYLKDYIRNLNEYDDVCSVCSLPYYLDAYIIRNCPIEAVQAEEKINYGGSYDDIKSSALYTSPKRDDVPIGRHFVCIKRPRYKINRPHKRFGSKLQPWWSISVHIPEELGDMWYHTSTKTWDFCDEFVIGDGWITSDAHAKTIKAVKRKIRKWNLPVNTTVEVWSRRIADTYLFIVRP